MKFKKLIKLIIEVVLVVIVCYLVYDNRYEISNFLLNTYKKYFASEIKQNLTANEYQKKVNYDYVKINTNTNIDNKEDARNAIYTFLDAGWSKYTVMCNVDYLNCTSDIKEMVENETYLTDIGNFVHPFNTFEEINTTFSSSGKVVLKKTDRYTNAQINDINQKIEEIYNNNYDKSKNVKENIKIFHDYIINNTKYDVDNTSGLSSINSSTAYGVLIDGVGICSGYTDAMQLFLEKLNVKNYRVSSNTHTWNLVFIEGEWKHLDLTWDDPINSDGSDSISYDFFLIDTNDLKEKTDTEHHFDENIYLESK